MKKLNRTIQTTKYIRSGRIDDGPPHPKILYKHDGTNGAVYESKPVNRENRETHEFHYAFDCYFYQD